jgi:2-(1,2-epoxy-1,2-dihydrophenyl)acetyl-CoA isomerase
VGFETIRFDVSQGVARVTLARPEAANTIGLALARELAEAALRCDEDRSVRAVLLTGEGKLFCGGGDIGAFAEAGDGVPALLKQITAHLHVAVSRFARGRAPVIAAVNGAAAGAGLALACAADVALASDAAKFTLAYTRIGLAPDGSSTWYLPRLVGTRRALELLLTNRTLTAQEALEMGLVNRVVPAASLLAEAEKLARELADGPTEAFAAVKRLLLLSPTQGLEAQMELEAHAIADAARTADGKEGIASFLEKRAPRFTGN